MTEEIPTINLNDAEKFEIIEPEVQLAFGGRLMGSDYINVEGENLHKVHIDLVLTTEQYIALMRMMGNETIQVNLV